MLWELWEISCNSIQNPITFKSKKQKSYQGKICPYNISWHCIFNLLRSRRTRRCRRRRRWTRSASSCSASLRRTQRRYPYICCTGTMTTFSRGGGGDERCQVLRAGSGMQFSPSGTRAFLESPRFPPEGGGGREGWRDNLRKSWISQVFRSSFDFFSVDPTPFLHART